MQRWIVPLAASLVLLPPTAIADGPSPERQSELLELLRQDCGSCHGLTLKGGLGPALLPEALAGKPPAFLETAILDGRPGTAMPPWRPLLSEAEVAWMVERLLQGEVAR
jgi:cytochrome c55X